MTTSVRCLVALLCVAWSSAERNATKVISLTVDVSSKQKQCFYELFQDGGEYLLTYTVIRGGVRDLTVDVYQPPAGWLGNSTDGKHDAKSLYKKLQRASDKVKLTIAPGTCAFCFANGVSRKGSKVIRFSLLRREKPQTREESAESTTTPEPELIFVDLSLDRLVDILKSLRESQKQQRAVHAKGYDAAKHLNTYVTAWSLTQVIVFILLGLGQVCLLKMLFTERKVSRKKTGWT